jgi:hypothetical protein
MEPILGLVERHRPGAVEHLVGDLLAAVRRRAVNDQCVRQVAQLRVVDLGLGEAPHPLARSESLPIEVHTSV